MLCGKCQPLSSTASSKFFIIHQQPDLVQVNMSVAVIPMAEELGWSATDRGLVSSAFFWGYALTQIPAGYISTK